MIDQEIKQIKQIPNPNVPTDQFFCLKDVSKLTIELSQPFKAKWNA